MRIGIIYASPDDNIPLSTAWTQIKHNGLQLKTYPQMNHPEMVALQRQNLLQDIAADLLSRTITPADTHIVGKLCDRQ